MKKCQQSGNKHYLNFNGVFNTGRWPHKQYPDETIFAKDAFENMLPKCVEEELYNAEQSRIIYLHSGFVTDWKSHSKGFKTTVRVDHTDDGTCTPYFTKPVQKSFQSKTFLLNTYFLLFLPTVNMSVNILELLYFRKKVHNK